MLEDAGHVHLSCQSNWGESIPRVEACCHRSTQQSCTKAAAVRAVLLCCPSLRGVLQASNLNQMICPKPKAWNRPIFKLRAELGLLYPWWTYLCICMCKPAQTRMFTGIFSCFVDTVMHKDEPSHNKSGLTRDMQLPRKHQPVPFSAPLPTRGS